MNEQQRVFFDKVYYHITARGNRRELIWRDDRDRFFYLSKLEEYRKCLKFEIFAYVLMPNHVHLAIAAGPIKTISHIMQRLSLSYAKYYNNRYRTCGHLWQGRFHSRVITDENYFSNLIAYIEGNPVRAKLVDAPCNYMWSSANARDNESRFVVSLSSISN